MTADISGTTRGLSDNKDTETQHVTYQTTHTTLPSSTSGQMAPDLRFSEPSVELVGSSSNVTSSTSSEVRLLIDLSDKESIPLATADENNSLPLLNEWEKSDEEIHAATGSSVANISEKLYSYTQSPETVSNRSSESSTDNQSDSPTDAFLLVSADSLCAAGLISNTGKLLFTHNQKLLQKKSSPFWKIFDGFLSVVR